MANETDIAAPSVRPPDHEPRQIQAGTSCLWTRADLGGDYPAATWSLTYYGLSRSGKIEIVAGPDPNSTGFLVALKGTDTAPWAPGRYQVTGRVANAVTGEVYNAFGGELEILADPAQQDVGFDTRSFNERALEAIENALLSLAGGGRLADDVAGFRIQTAGGSLREINRLTPAELAVERARYQAYIESERRAEDIANGRGGRNFVAVRF